MSETSPAVDVAAWVGSYPFRGIVNSSPNDLRDKARLLNMRFVVGSFDSLFQENNLDAYDRWCDQLADHDYLEHWPVVNIAMPGQLRQLEPLLDRHRPRGLRLLPNYHGYRLWDPEINRLMAMAAERHMIVQIFMCIADERWHFMLKTPAVSRDDIDHVTGCHTEAHIILSGCSDLQWIAPRMRECPYLYADISRIRGPSLAMEHLSDFVPMNKLLLGSLWPIQIIESTLWQITWAKPSPETKAMVLHRNFECLMESE